MKIFLIDDQPISNLILQKLILAYEDLPIHSFKSVEQALDKLEHLHPDLIILDLHFPGLDGWDLLQRMAGTDIKSKVAVLTSSTSKADKEHCLSFPSVIRYFTKPIAMNKLHLFLREFQSSLLDTSSRSTDSELIYKTP